MAMDKQIYTRYHRQLILPGFGMDAQQRLLNARVLVIGAGGLGCPVLTVLTGAGIGTIGIVDDGLVELSNLHRQLIYSTADVGLLKVECASRVLRALNPSIVLNTYPLRLHAGNALDILSDYDLIIDGTDNFQTRYMVADACALLGKPLVYGAISRYEGQVALFDGPVSYRDLFPHPPGAGEVPNCSEAGVLGVLPGIIGHFMANEAIKFLTGIGEPLTGRLLTYSALDNRVFTVTIPSTIEGADLLPRSREDFEGRDYPALCGVQAVSGSEIDVDGFHALLERGGVEVVDVREYHEQPELQGIAHRRIPLSVLPQQMDTIQSDADTVVFVCQSGARSLRAASAFQAAGPSAHALRVYSLKGGVHALLG